MENDKKKLKTIRKLEKEYDKVCDKIEQLNDYAFILEKEIYYLRSKTKEVQE